MSKTSVAKTREVAEEIFMSGMNCAESALLALAAAQSIESPCIPNVATCFGGGMSRTGGTCGAITGTLMGIGLALGRSTPETSPQIASGAGKAFIQKFETEFGACLCHELLGYDPKDPDTHGVFQEEGTRPRCANYTGRAVEIAAEIIQEKQA